MKKSMAMAAAAILALSLAGCSGQGSEPEETSAASVETAAETEDTKAEDTEATGEASEESGQAEAEDSKEEAGSASGSESGETYEIGICQLVQHPALDSATEGFQAALTELLGDRVDFDLQNAAGDSPITRRPWISTAGPEQREPIFPAPPIWRPLTSRPSC